MGGDLITDVSSGFLEEEAGCFLEGEAGASC